MQTFSLPNTDLAPSVLCLGGVPLGSALDERQSFAVLDAFVAHGGTFLDTAKVYADWLPGERSVSEKTLGRWLQQRKQRDRLVIATKGAHPELATMHKPRMTRQEIVADLEQSLRNLQTDVIDLYWLHRDDPQTPVAAILDTLEEQVRAGKIRAYRLLELARRSHRRSAGLCPHAGPARLRRRPDAVEPGRRGAVHAARPHHGGHGRRPLRPARRRAGCRPSPMRRRPTATSSAPPPARSPA